WDLQLEQAIMQSAVTGICIGTNKFDTWLEKELDLALSYRKKNPSHKVISILLPGFKFDKMPLMLSQQISVDFTQGIKNSKALKELENVLHRERISADDVIDYGANHTGEVGESEQVSNPIDLATS